jgi:DMATS type aromatic prenyltransferase
MGPTTPVSLGDSARMMSDVLARELGVDACSDELIRVLRGIAADWFDLEIGDTPPFGTDITDDGSPFEFSAAFEGPSVELRILAEAQQFPYDIESNWHAGLAANQRLERDFGVDLSGFDRVKDLFQPGPQSEGPFAIWHAAALREGESPLLKVYLNPSARGAGRERATVREAMRRLGRAASWTFIEEQLAANSAVSIRFFALDLVAGKTARVKVYLAHADADTDTIERATRRSRGYRAGEVRDFVEAVAGSTGPFSDRPLLVCHAFSGRSAVPVSTVHVPVRCYVNHDAQVLGRCEQLIEPALRPGLWRAAQRVSGRELDRGAGFVTYASARCDVSVRRLTLYLAPQLYSCQELPRIRSVPPANSFVAPRGAAVGLGAARPSMLTVQDAIHRAQLLLREHPFIQRLNHGADLAQVRSMTRALTFFVMSFQDVLRLSRMTIVDPALRAMAETHEREDHGHDQWFLHDAQRLGAASDLPTVFSSDHEAVRDVSYRLIAEVLTATDDTRRLAVVLCLEAAGAEFFHRVIGLLDRLGVAGDMRYFARSHQAVEESHEVFDSDAQLALASVQIPAGSLGAVLGSVERSFVAISRLADEMERRMALCERDRSVA